jgi:ATP-dependent exoDNAse (exonuclease V) beta subunit
MTKQFKHRLVSLPDLEAETINGKRHYIVDENTKFPSVTTVLDGTADKTWLQEWKRRVGEEEAERISTKAKNKGTLLHKMAEDFVLNKPVNNNSPIAMMTFQPIKKALETRVDDILLVEGCLWSEKLRIAGRCDLIAHWDGKPAIVDYKTSSSVKHESDIKDYFIQLSMYAFMFWERTNIAVNDIVILMATSDIPEPQIFEKKASDYIREARARIRAYEALQRGF